MIDGGDMLNQVRSSYFFLSLFALILFLAPASFAQVDRGAIVGSVSDATSASVADAKVTVTNLAQPARAELG